ncbi:MAG: lipopolysaccharide transport periplasmic protein LptA [Desulfuromonas sp.]|nr:lipopolysaccharide transport periplasmic protein LptA [Desulfuromonas sp.]
MRYLLTLVFILIVLVTSSAAEQAELKHDASLPVHITSQRLEADDFAGFFIFEGDVQAQQGDVYIYADKLTVFYTDSEKKEIDRVVAETDVRIVQLQRVATGQKAIFFQQQGRVELTGDPRVVQGENVVEGEKIVVFLNDNRSIVEGGEKGRVKAIFVPGQSPQ